MKYWTPRAKLLNHSDDVRDLTVRLFAVSSTLPRNYLLSPVVPVDFHRKNLLF